jgi:hypothetical protein
MSGFGMVSVEPLGCGNRDICPFIMHDIHSAALHSVLQCTECIIGG